MTIKSAKYQRKIKFIKIFNKYVIFYKKLKWFSCKIYINSCISLISFSIRTNKKTKIILKKNKNYHFIVISRNLCNCIFLNILIFKLFVFLFVKISDFLSYLVYFPFKRQQKTRHLQENK